MRTWRASAAPGLWHMGSAEEDGEATLGPRDSIHFLATPTSISALMVGRTRALQLARVVDVSCAMLPSFRNWSTYRPSMAGIRRLYQEMLQRDVDRRSRRQASASPFGEPAPRYAIIVPTPAAKCFPAGEYTVDGREMRGLRERK